MKGGLYVVQSIELIDVKKTYVGDGIETHAVHQVSLKFQKGQFASIIGPSGSGKSTLLSMIGSLDFPTSGDISYDDVRLSKMNGNVLSDFRFQNLGFVFQQFHLLPTLTAIENVMAPVFPRRVRFNKTQRAEELLEKVGLAHRRNALPSQLSGGEQQRVAIARALINQPDWLLADEPTGNLDTDNGAKVFELLRTLNQEGCGIVLITHDDALAAKTDRIVRMKDGVVVGDTERGA
jgi:ABC-type lipoprotein export system ATPase subunit